MTWLTVSDQSCCPSFLSLPDSELSWPGVLVLRARAPPGGGTRSQGKEGLLIDLTLPAW